MEKKEESRYALRMPRETFKRLRVLAAMRERSINALIVGLIEAELESAHVRLPSGQDSR